VVTLYIFVSIVGIPNQGITLTIIHFPYQRPFVFNLPLLYVTCLCW